MKCLDYVFYRVTKTYLRFKWEKDPWFTGVISVCLIVSMLFVDLFALIRFTIFKDQDLFLYKEEAKIIFLIISVILLIFFSIRYNKKYDELKKKWESETKIQRIVRGFLVIVGILLPIVVPMLDLALFGR